MYVYLLHFDQNLHHAGHYTGSTTDLKRRLTDHANGDAARLTEVLAEIGTDWEVARVWTCDDRTAEAWIKRQHNGASFCPICHEFNYRSPRKMLDFPIDAIPFPIRSKELRTCNTKSRTTQSSAKTTREITEPSQISTQPSKPKSDSSTEKMFAEPT